jgi:phosphocarrier protein FPr
LVGLGVDEFSVSVPAIPEIKAAVRALALTECRARAQQAVRQDTAAAVRALSPSLLEDDASGSPS